MLIWKNQSLIMKRVWISLCVLTVFILVHGTYTFRLNHQIAFAQAVEKKIDIVSIHVTAKNGALILQGRASRQQAEYAEEIARMFIAKYAKRAINAPTTVKNEIETGSVVSKSAPKAHLRRLAGAR
jgi:uncharacterized membrane protein affecting hemolysin expression